MFGKNFTTSLLERTPSPYNSDLSRFLLHTETLNRKFSCAVRQVLRQISEGEIKFYQFTDIPVVEVIPPTATAYISQIPKHTYQSEGIIGAVSQSLGSLFGYEETSKFIIYDIYPVRGLEESRSFVNSKKMLGFHSDGSAHPQRSPDYVLLYCIRSDPNAVNLIVDADTLVRALPNRVVDVLMQARFRHLVSQFPERYESKPVLSIEDSNICIKYDEDNVFGLDQEAINAQNALNEGIRQVSVEVTNPKNSLLIINNKRCLHARTGFAPNFDGKDRWIKGAFVSKENIQSGSILRLSL